MTFYYTNQQSARLMFYHDHAWGITRLNVYAGEAAGYLITDATEQALISGGKIPGPADTIPLVIQDRTFVPQGDPVTRTGQLYEQDPTWDESRWGGYGNLWYHHVYMPAQNPGDPSGMSAYGRWMYGPWFWPPAGTALYQPIANPYYNPACNLDDPATWQYQTDPFCEPQLIPGTPNISVGMEQFNDTPIVNGTAYPTLNLEPKTYRFRILNAANDRFFNLQWYVADPSTASTALNAAGQPIGGTEVALNAAELAAAQTDPNVFPTPDTTISPAGPSWIQIGTEGGFLPAPVVVPNQPITWIIDPTRFDVGNVDLHSLLLAPAERADVIVDFSAVRRQDADPVQRRTGGLPGPGRQLRLLHGRPGPEPGRRPDHPARLRAEHPHHHAGQDRGQPAGARLQPDGAADCLQAPRGRLGRVRVRPEPDHRRAGRLQLGLRHQLCRQQLVQRSRQAPINRCDGFARISEQGGDLFGFNTLTGAQRQAVDQARAQGDPRRDERRVLRRVRPDDGQPRPRGRAGHAGRRRTSSSIRS